MDLTTVDALRAYAKMMNTLSVEPIVTILADGFIYESQIVLQPLMSKEAFLEYIKGKFNTIRQTKATVFAEMGTVFAYGEKQPCVILAQYDKENLVGLVLAKTNSGKLSRLDVCIIPPPQVAQRTGEYPT